MSILRSVSISIFLSLFAAYTVYANDHGTQEIQSDHNLISVSYQQACDSPENAAVYLINLAFHNDSLIEQLETEIHDYLKGRDQRMESTLVSDEIRFLQKKRSQIKIENERIRELKDSCLQGQSDCVKRFIALIHEIGVQINHESDLADQLNDSRISKFLRGLTIGLGFQGIFGIDFSKSVSPLSTLEIQRLEWPEKSPAAKEVARVASDPHLIAMDKPNGSLVRMMDQCVFNPVARAHRQTCEYESLSPDEIYKKNDTIHRYRVSSGVVRHLNDQLRYENRDWFLQMEREKVGEMTAQTWARRHLKTQRFFFPSWNDVAFTEYRAMIYEMKRTQEAENLSDCQLVKLVRCAVGVTLEPSADEVKDEVWHYGVWQLLKMGKASPRQIALLNKLFARALGLEMDAELMGEAQTYQELPVMNTLEINGHSYLVDPVGSGVLIPRQSEK